MRNANRPAQIEPVGRCNLACKMCTVNERGDAVATADRATFGNVFDDGLRARWNGPAAQAFRQSLAHDAPPAVCRSRAPHHGMF